MIHTSSLTRIVHFSEVNVQLYASGHNYWSESLFEVVYFGECVVVTHRQTRTSGSRRTSSKMNANIYEVRIQLQFSGCKCKLLTIMQKLTKPSKNQLSLKSACG